MIIQFLKKEKIKYEENIDLSNFSYLKTGGNAKLITYPNSENQIQQLIFFLKKREIKYKVIGFTANILFLDEHEYGFFISLKGISKIIYKKKSKTINVSAGHSLGFFVDYCVDKGISGFECLEGIPGTIGGAITMNAGAYGQSISDYLINVNCINSDGEYITYNIEELNYSYRNSLFRENPKITILNANFTTRPGNIFELAFKKDMLNFKRKKYNDYSYPTLGSLFATLDIYNDLCKIHPKYKRFLQVISLILKLFNFFRNKKNNNRKIQNAFTEWYFNFVFDIQPYSDKTLNCLTNKSQGTREMLQFILLMRKNLNYSVELENEILTPDYKNLSNEKNWYNYLS